MRLPKVTVCIPAYNEEANIKNLLLSILSQAEDGFVLEEVLVCSDGSTDGTVLSVSSIADARVMLRHSEIRRGKVAIINEQLKACKSDVLVQFDADIKLPDAFVISKLVKPFLKDDYPDVVCGMHWPLPPRTFIEQLAYFGADCWEVAKIQLGEYGDMYNSLGQVRAFSSRFIKNLTLPKDVGTFEDTYIFLFAKSKGYKVAMAHDAVVNFRLASTWRDYIKQMSRFVIVKEIAKQYFSSKFIKRYEHMTLWVRAKVFLSKVFIYPLYISLGYLVLQLIVKLRASIKFAHVRMWDSAGSSKVIE